MWAFFYLSFLTVIGIVVSDRLDPSPVALTIALTIGALGITIALNKGFQVRYIYLYVVIIF